MNSSIRVDPKAVAALREPQVRELYFFWPVWAREAQVPPRGEWTTWMMMGGRGSGKTRAGAEWIRTLVAREISPIAIVSESMVEVLAVMVRGESGILRVHPADERPKVKGTTLVWPNGVEAIVLGASDPERFRGPQFAAAWCDELGKWTRAEEAWDMLQFGLRLGARPRQLVTTTPRPTKLLKRLLAEPGTVVTRMTSAENRAHLADGFLKAIVARYRDTVLGRQELEGELIEDLPDALWQRSMFRRWPSPASLSEAPSPASGRGEAGLERIVVAVDPPASSGARSDACGIVVAGRIGDEAVVLADLTVQPAAPLVWAKRAVEAFHTMEADCIVAEVNQGGDMVRAVIAQVDASVPVKAVRANRGKWVRAEPVAALYAQGRVMHRPGLSALEDEMCGFGADGTSGGRSPDRVDALVWALTELMLGDRVVPRVR